MLYFLRWIKLDMFTTQGYYCSLQSLVGLIPYRIVKNIEASKELAAFFFPERGVGEFVDKTALNYDSIER